jgi:hypothetical protein
LGGGEEKRVRKERLKGRRQTRTREAMGVSIFFALPLRFLSPRAGGCRQRGRGERVKRERERERERERVNFGSSSSFPSTPLSILPHDIETGFSLRLFFFFAAGSLFLSLSLSR